MSTLFWSTYDNIDALLWINFPLSINHEILVKSTNFACLYDFANVSSRFDFILILSSAA